MDEENFEKKSSKKALKIVLLVILLLAIAGVILFLVLNKMNSKPEKVFNKAVEQMFEASDKVEDYKTVKMDLELSAGVEVAGSSSIDSDVKSQIDMISSILKTAKLRANIAYDLENQVIDTELSAKYEGKDVISFEAIVQNGKAYAYLKDLYSKYIELPIEELEEDLDLDALFEMTATSTKVSKDVKEILKTKIEESEFEDEEVEVEIAGKDKKVNKSTLRLTAKEVSEIAYDILSKVKEYQTNSEVKYALEEILEELKDVDETENYVDIAIYSEKTGNNIVKVDIVMVNKVDEQVIAMAATEVEDKKWEIVLSMNEYSTSVKDATDLFKVEITEENENEGTVSVIAEVEGLEITLNVDYKVEYNEDVAKKNVKNSIKADEFGEEDLMEIYENAQNNEILKAIIDMAMQTYGTVSENTPSYDYTY